MVPLNNFQPVYFKVKNPRTIMRITAIDIEANSIRMIVVKIRPERSFKVIHNPAIGAKW